MQVLGMEALPAPKFQQRQWRFTRKRRRSGADGVDAEGKKTINNLLNNHPAILFCISADGKVQKKDGVDAVKADGAKAETTK